MTYKELFKLAEDKGYKMFFKSHPYPIQIENSKDETAREFEFFEIGRIQKWLRAEHNNIHIVIDKTADGYVFTGYDHRGAKTKELWIEENFKTYEDALLNGINKALNLI